MKVARATEWKGLWNFVQIFFFAWPYSLQTCARKSQKNSDLARQTKVYVPASRKKRSKRLTRGRRGRKKSHADNRPAESSGSSATGRGDFNGKIPSIKPKTAKKRVLEKMWISSRARSNKRKNKPLTSRRWRFFPSFLGKFFENCYHEVIMKKSFRTESTSRVERALRKIWNFSNCCLPAHRQWDFSSIFLILFSYTHPLSRSIHKFVLPSPLHFARMEREERSRSSRKRESEGKRHWTKRQFDR